MSLPRPCHRKKPYRAQSVISLSCLLAVIFVSTGAFAKDANTILRHIDELWRGESSQAEMSMTVKTRRYTRSMSMQTWSKGSEYSLVLITAPVKDKGIATLKVKDNIWNYLPKINRVTKVPASMMSGSWMGSHFTNDDLIQESRFLEDFNSEIIFEGERDGNQIIELRSIPRENAAIVWGKVEMEVYSDTLVPIANRYYDEKGELIRTMTFDKVEQVGGRRVPMRMILQPADKPDESTEITYQSIHFEVDIDESFFSLQNLQRSR